MIDRQHGQQFKADELKTTHPASAEGIEKYLASGAIRSIGPKIAAKIVSVYKERTLDIFENYADLLLHVKGIGAERLKRIRQSWQEQKEVRKIMLFLTEHGITPGRAVRVYRTYGHEAIAKIKENPYQLADDIRGIGFKTADELAAKLGIDRNSPYRARAAVQYTLQDLASKGHCGYPESGVVEHAIKLVEIEQKIIEDAVRIVVQDGSVIREFVEGEPWLYLAALYRAEVGLAQSAHRIASATPHPLPRIDVEKAITWVEQRLDIQLAAAQQEAIRQACQHKMLVITGGPDRMRVVSAACNVAGNLGHPSRSYSEKLVSALLHPEFLFAGIELACFGNRFNGDRDKRSPNGLAGLHVKAPNPI